MPRWMSRVRPSIADPRGHRPYSRSGVGELARDDGLPVHCDRSFVGHVGGCEHQVRLARVQSRAARWRAGGGRRERGRPALRRLGAAAADGARGRDRARPGHRPCRARPAAPAPCRAGSQARRPGAVARRPPDAADRARRFLAEHYHPVVWRLHRAGVEGARHEIRWLPGRSSGTSGAWSAPAPRRGWRPGPLSSRPARGRYARPHRGTGNGPPPAGRRSACTWRAGRRGAGRRRGARPDAGGRGHRGTVA